MANFVKLYIYKFPKTKGKRIDGMRFYEVDGKAIRLSQRIRFLRKQVLDAWRKNVGEEVKWK